MVGNDDGSLSFLNIPRDASSRSFNCDETTQSKLMNTTFWVVDFIEDVPTRFSKAKGTMAYGWRLRVIIRFSPSPQTGIAEMGVRLIMLVIYSTVSIRGCARVSRSACAVVRRV